MESTTFTRRKFLSIGTQACIGCISVMAFAGNQAFGNPVHYLKEDEPVNPKVLNYCGYKCPADCKFLKASLENNVALKKEAFELWKIKERHGIEFDADKIFCFGCKNFDKPEGIVLKNCTVRSCAIEKGFDSCIECKELESCQKELWDLFPDFKKYVIEMQTKYFISLKAL